MKHQASKTANTPIRRARWGWWAAGIVAGALACAGCGSSGSSGGGSGGNGSSGADLTAVDAAAGSYTKMPTEILQKPALKQRPSGSRTIIYILDNGVTQETYVNKGVSAGAAAVGWKDKVLDIDQTDPSSLVAALKESLQYKPAAVIVSGSPVSQIASVLPQYKAAGVPIIMNQTIATVKPPIIANLVGAQYSQKAGKELADWFISDSKGKGSVLVAGGNLIPVTQAASAAFESRAKSACPGCHVDTVDLPLAQAIGGTANPIVASALRRHPDDSYLLLTEGSWFTGISSTLSSAGIQNTKIMSMFSWLNNLNAVKQGEEKVTVGNSLQELGWIDVDAILRHSQGMNVPPEDGGLPDVLLTQSSTFSPSPDFSVPADYPKQFKALWHVG